jgi:hypothetical protein
LRMEHCGENSFPLILKKVKLKRRMPVYSCRIDVYVHREHQALKPAPVSILFLPKTNVTYFPGFLIKIRNGTSLRNNPC